MRSPPDFDDLARPAPVWPYPQRRLFRRSRGRLTAYLTVLGVLTLFALIFSGTYFIVARSPLTQLLAGQGGTTAAFPTLPPATAQAGPTQPPTATAGPNGLRYYGASLDGMRIATGIAADGSLAANGPWPQASGNYCSLATLQGLINYIDWASGQAIKYPTRAGQGPVTGSSAPADPTQEQPGQLLYDMDHSMVATFAPGLQVLASGVHRRPFTLANISHDAGLDPRSLAVAVAYETSNIHPYHQHVYHNDPLAVAKDLAYWTAKYQEPVIVAVNQGLHSELIAGVWAYSDPATDPNATIDSFATYNPWNENWGYFMDGKYFERVPLQQFAYGHTGDGATWLSRPYNINGTYDPDPYMGPYQAGTDPYTGPTANPNAHFWLGNIVVVQRDDHADNNPDNAYDENDQLMTGP